MSPNKNDLNRIRESATEQMDRIYAALRRPIFQQGRESDDSVATQAQIGAPGYIYAEGYKTGSDRLIDSLESSNWGTDWLVYPIVYGYRHCIELMLKEIIYSLWAYAVHSPSERNEKIMKSHNLHKLWNVTMKAFDLAGYEQSQSESHSNVRDRIMEFHQYDPSGVAFRYSTTINRMESSLPDLSHVNLSQMKIGFEAIWAFLDGTDTMIHEANVARAEAREYEADARAEAAAENAQYNAEMQAEMNAEMRADMDNYRED